MTAGEKVMARRNVLQELPVPVPQAELQSYEVVLEEEDAIPYNKQTPSSGHPHSRFISNDEAKENITPSQFEDIFKGKTSPVKVLDSSDGPGASGSSLTGDENVSTPRRSTEGDLQPSTTPIDFSTVTVGDLGISSESFTTKCSGKSPKSLHKHRRRSTIGVRGSPEMNFLIRQIALQRSNRKEEPEPLDNPFTSPRNSVLREKISAFRNAFQAVEETEGKLSFPGFSEAEELDPEKGSREVVSEPPGKRKKLCHTTDPSDEPSVTCPAPAAKGEQKSVPEKTLDPVSSLASKLSSDVPSAAEEAQSDKAQPISTTSRCRKRKVMFAGLLSPPEPESQTSEASAVTALKPVLKKTPRRDFSYFRVGFVEERRVLFSLEESADNDCNNKPEDSTKKKKVTFGRELSPELFDKTLPANTPLRRGSTPYNRGQPDDSPSAEPTLDQSPCDPIPQPDFSDREEEETFQPQSLCFDAESSDSDFPVPFSLSGHKEESGPKEEEDGADHTWSSANHELVASSSEETGAVTDIVNESFITAPEVSPAAARKTRSSNKRKLTNTEETPEGDGPKAKVKAAVKKTRKPVIGKRLLVKAVREKGKRKGGKSKKKVVYSEREVVSKRPLLSPIPELPESVPTPPASASHGFSYGKAYLEDLVKSVHEQRIHLTFEDPLTNIEEEDPERSPVSDRLEDVKVSHNGSPEKTVVISLAPQVDQSSSEGPPPTTSIEGTDEFSKPVPSSLEEETNKTKKTKSRSSTRKMSSHPSISSENAKLDEDVDNVSHKQGPNNLEEEINKTKKTRRRSSTHKMASHPSIPSENAKLDEDADHISHKPVTGSEDPVQEPIALSSISNQLPEGTTTTSSSVTTEHKKSRRSSRNHLVAPTNPEPNIPAEVASAMLPHLIDPTTIDFCLPIDEVLQFPPQEKKVRRSMRHRRDSGVIGLSWVEENKNVETTDRRKSLTSVVRLEENPELSSYDVSTTARRTRRRTLCTTTIQESAATIGNKRRMSGCFHKEPNSMSVGKEAVQSSLVSDV
ncbi:cell division cycle-associated protein 2 isoform X1 [Engystomops pustulosus]|uniref:cell division cycle-associated protein 2 isoform X1 n=1 Tax=Engystomops pustulosus TaxID=76066 RepID=UPI003AFA7B8D